MNRGTPPFRELRPLAGARIDALETAWFLGDKDDRNEIEVVLELLRRQATTDRSRLLQPPGGSEADGPIRLGRIAHGRENLGWLGITTQDLCSHGAILGRSGSGKSNLCLHILLQLLERGIPWLVFDYKRSARALRGLPLGKDVQVLSLGRDIGATLCFNIMVPAPGVPVDTHQRQLAELLSEVWFAGDGVISVISKAMAECYAAKHPAYPTIADVAQAVEDMPAKSREIMWKTSAQRILRQMTTGQLGRILNTVSHNTLLDKLRHGWTVLELDGLAVADAAFLVQFLARHLTHVLLAESQRETLRFCMLIEESHHLLPKTEGGRPSLLENVLREGREIGLGVILADQSISAVSATALANCFTTVCMNVRHRADVQAAAGNLLLDETQRELLSTLPVGEGICRLSDRWPWPVHIRVPALHLPKGQVTDDDLRAAFVQGPYLSAELIGGAAGSADSTDSGAHMRAPDERRVISRLPPRDEYPQTTDSKRPVHLSNPSEVNDAEPVANRSELDDTLNADGELRLLLEHIAREPLRGVAQRYEALGMSRRKGDALKRQLVELGAAVAVEVPIPSGKTVLLALSEPARRWLTRHHVPITPLNGSLPHAFWQGRAVEILGTAGWDAAAEHVARAHAFDVYAERQGRRLVLEVETGSSSWAENLVHLEQLDASDKAVLWLDPSTLLKVKSVLPPGVTLVQPGTLERWVRSRIDS